MIKKIALITPINGDWAYDSYMALDGLIQLKKEKPDIEFFISSDPYRKHPFPAIEYALPKKEFIEFAKNADLILLFWCKKDTDSKLAEEIGEWNKTAYVDGSEWGMNKGRDFAVQREVLSGEYKDWGRIDDKMLSLCPLYFRREKPYIKGVTPLPYGITSTFTKYYEPAKPKDIDFFCVWGQDEYPLTRRYAEEILVDFCKKNGFTYHVEKTKNRDEFYEILSRSKVGVSIGGGGYDTARFWEILGNNCLLLTERIDILEPDSRELDYERIYQFNNLYDFKYQLEKVAKFLREEYGKTDLLPEYREIMTKHSSKARVLKLIQEAEVKLKKDEENGKLCSIVVSSFDGNADIWDPFFTLFFRYWPNCPYPVYLITNRKEYSDKRVITIKVGDDKGWATNIRNALKDISTPYVINLMEDFLIEKPVNNRYIQSLVDYASLNKIAYIRLLPNPGPDKYFLNDLSLGEIDKKSSYRTSLHAAIWGKKVFLDLLVDGENPWNLELEG